MHTKYQQDVEETQYDAYEDSTARSRWRAFVNTVMNVRVA
jgi:hypothetical protein